MRDFAVYVSKDEESGMYVGTVPSIRGAHTFAKSLDELRNKMEEVVLLCLEEMENDEIESIPEYNCTMRIAI
ncbi:MAG: type II toxin-antitoxin system HicB family antitoxin [Oscillospiraceae bacterium]|jgi:predicted RNase H-like HicB family nuclease|nr:type II toxin-antitoxin system HicB family antitoxin [Oscillospiraceae bacterium]